MRNLNIVAAAPIVAIALLAAPAAGAGNAPVVNETTHYRDEPLDDVGFNCATGNLATIKGHFSGHIRTQVQPDGSFRLRGTLRGSESLDDLPDDGVVDATATFVLTFADMWLPPGTENHREALNGKLTLTATGETVRFHYVARLLIDADGVVRVAFENLACE